MLNLHSYQEKAREHILNNKRCALWLPMGAGKTITVLSCVKNLPKPILVIAPLRVARDVWLQEITKWQMPIKAVRVIGSPTKRTKALNTDAEMYITNREQVSWLAENNYKSWGTIIIDESSSFKTLKTERFRAMKKMSYENMIQLTGTPATNGLQDLFAQVYLLDGGARLGKHYQKFIETYFIILIKVGYAIWKMTPKPHAMKQIQQVLSDICFTHDDIVKIPRKDTTVECYLTPTEEKNYKSFEKTMVYEEGLSALNATSLGNKLLQLANGSLYKSINDIRTTVHIHDHKLEALESVVEEANGKPVLVMYSFQFDKERILKKFKHARLLDTEQDVLEWNKGNIPIAIAHPLSCGHGLNLQQGGNILCWYGLTFSLEQFQQAEARLIRQGQKETVYVYYIITKGTRDERILPLLKGKAKTQRELINLFFT